MLLLLTTPHSLRRPSLETHHASSLSAINQLPKASAHLFSRDLSTQLRPCPSSQLASHTSQWLQCLSSVPRKCAWKEGVGDRSQATAQCQVFQNCYLTLRFKHVGAHTHTHTPPRLPQSRYPNITPSSFQWGSPISPGDESTEKTSRALSWGGEEG